MLSDYTAIILKSGEWYAGFIKELPGAHSQGKTVEEVRQNLKEAIRMIIESHYLHSIEGYENIIEERISVNL